MSQSRLMWASYWEALESAYTDTGDPILAKLLGHKYSSADMLGEACVSIVNGIAAASADVDRGLVSLVSRAVQESVQYDPSCSDIYANAMVRALRDGHRQLITVWEDIVTLHPGTHYNEFVTLADRGPKLPDHMIQLALVAAALAGKAKVVSRLVKVRGARIDLLSSSEVAAIVSAGHRQVIELLFERGANGYIIHVALRSAALAGKEEVVALLINRGVRMDLFSSSEVAAISTAGHIEVLALLFDRGANKHMMHVALRSAALAGRKETVSLLLDKGGEVDRLSSSEVAAISTAGHTEVLALLFDRGANKHMMHVALHAAALAGREEIVSLILDRGGGVDLLSSTQSRNFRRESGIFSTALTAALSRRKRKVVSLLLEQGADVNACGGTFGTALTMAVWQNDQQLVRVLLSRGANIHVTGGLFGTALGAAALAGNKRLSCLLISRGANVNASGGLYGSVLGAAVFGGHTKLVSMLLDSGANANSRCTMGTILTTVIHSSAPEDSTRGEAPIGIPANVDCLHKQCIKPTMDRKTVTTMILLLLKGGADVNADDGTYESALTAAICVYDQEILSLLLDYGADIHALGNYGTALTTAASANRVLLVAQLLEKGADINAIGGKYGTALSAAAYHGNEEIVSLLLERGADIHISAGDYGTALGAACATANQGRDRIISLLLDQGSNIHYVGGKYKTTDGRSTAWDAALYGGAGESVLTLLSNSRRRMAIVLDLAAPNLSYASSSPSEFPTAIDIQISDFHPGADLTPEQADIPCRALKENVLIDSLLTLVGIFKETATRLAGWIKSDIWYFISHNYDFGLAYATARVAWEKLNDLAFNVAAHRDRWHERSRKLDQLREKIIYKDETGQEVIGQPYKVMPRRIWDLKSNRVVSYQLLQAALQCSDENKVDVNPPFWAITHSWTSDLKWVEMPINQYQWPVPIPKELDLERDLRRELLSFGAEYIWLDVLCLRQVVGNHSSSHAIQETEWKLDVPTIGNIYREATNLVRYFNGLGIPFSSEGWDNDRHWLRRAWTLQEIKTENTTFNGGMSRLVVPHTPGGRVILNAKGTLQGGKVITLRRAIRTVLKLAADVDSSRGCTVYELSREMAQRHATQATDKVAGLLYLLRTNVLPTYNAQMSDENVWAQCFHGQILPFSRIIEILFDFPYRGGEQQWFPTWKQLMGWPARDPEYEHSLAEAQAKFTLDQPDLPLVPLPGMFSLTPHPEARTQPFCFVTHIWVTPKVQLRHFEIEDGHEYEITIGNKFFGFYCPYLNQDPIPDLNASQEYTLATSNLGHSYNWVVGQTLGEQKVRCKAKSDGDDGDSIVIEVEIIKKLGVLRTDSCSELSGLLRKVNAVFV